MIEKIKVASTSVTDVVFARDTSVTTKTTGLTGLAFNTSGLTLYYRRQGASADVAVTLVTATLGTWTSGGFKLLDDTNMPGQVEIGYPNAALAAGATYVTFTLRGATNMEDIQWTVMLDAVDYQDAVHFGLGALPNTNVTTNASLLTSGAGTDQLTVSGGRVAIIAGTITSAQFSNASIIGSMFASSALNNIASAVWQDATAGDFTVAGSIGKSLFTSGTAPGGTGGLLIAGNNSATTFATLTSTGAFTINGTVTVAQSGDSFLRIGATGSGLTSLASSATAISSVDYTTTRAAKLDHLDADITSRMATFSYTAPDNTDIVTALGDLVLLLARTDPTAAITTLNTTLNALRTDYTTARATKIDSLDATISSRLAASSYAAPDNADIVTALSDLVNLLARTDPMTAVTAVKTVTDKVATMLMTSGSNFTFTIDALKNGPQGSGGGGGGNGSGVIPVTHDTGGTDNLRFRFMGAGIDGAVVDAYLTEEWNANPLTAVKRAEVVTGTDGRWVSVMMLDPDDYTIVFSAPGYRTSTKQITVV